MPMIVILAAAALVSLPSEAAPLRASVQATATIRVIRAVQLKFGAPNPDAPPARECVLKTADGASQRAKLIEFQ
jgi:hypothetical protein